jgi:branched-chain amino acid transport system permease protein
MLFWQLRQRNASGAVCILASLGAYVIFQHGLSLAFGNDTLSYYDSVLPSSIARFGIVVTTPQVLILSAAGLSLACALAMLLGSRWGLLFRAVVSDADLSFALGISRNAVILCSVIAGSTLAGIAGILSCYDTHLEPSMGMNAFLMAVVVVLVAGKESILGIMLAALIVSVARTVGVWLFSSQWQNIAAFLVLLIVFAVRPQGLLGRQHSSFRE